MDDQYGETMTNADDPIPVVSVTRPTDENAAPPPPSSAKDEQSERRRDAVKRNLSASKLKEKLEEFKGQKSESSNSLQDKMVNMYAVVQQHKLSPNYEERVQRC